MLKHLLDLSIREISIKKLIGEVNSQRNVRSFASSLALAIKYTNDIWCHSERPVASPPSFGNKRHERDKKEQPVFFREGSKKKVYYMLNASSNLVHSYQTSAPVLSIHISTSLFCWLPVLLEQWAPSSVLVLRHLHCRVLVLVLTLLQMIIN